MKMKSWANLAIHCPPAGDLGGAGRSEIKECEHGTI
jgi:hypothetical protein